MEPPILGRNTAYEGGVDNLVAVEASGGMLSEPLCRRECTPLAADHADAHWTRSSTLLADFAAVPGCPTRGTQPANSDTATLPYLVLLGFECTSTPARGPTQPTKNSDLAYALNAAVDSSSSADILEAPH